MLFMLCSRSSNSYGNASLSIENTTFGEKISLYPNPTFGISNITFESTYDNVTLLMYDATGRIVKQESHNNIDRLQINTQDYASGIYFLQILSDDKYADLKLIKR